MDELKVDILGTPYTVRLRTPEQDKILEECAGYCDHTTHEIVIEGQAEPSFGLVKDYPAYQKRVLRHEIIHAFLFESGLGGDATYTEDGQAHPEMLVDWFARQAPKIYEVYMAAGV
ncbi:MAG: hypothetical protein IKP40_02675, partial [Clostridia bacterium]|nr:hypothetical protein [Clostridia bacterium]